MSFFKKQYIFIDTHIRLLTNCSARVSAKGETLRKVSKNILFFKNGARTFRNDFLELASSTGASTRNFLARKYPCPENYFGMSARSDQGFVALMTAIILSVILLTVTVALNQVGFLTRSEILDSEYKNRSIALAEGCADTAILNYANDPSYTVSTPTPVDIDGDPCSIDSIVQDLPGGKFTVGASSVFPDPSVTSQGAHTKLKVVVNSADLSVVSWEEEP